MPGLPCSRCLDHPCSCRPPTPPQLPTTAERAYARDIVERRYVATLTALLAGHHIDHIAQMVFNYTEGEDDPTPGDIATKILQYVAALIADTAPTAHIGRPLNQAERAHVARIMADATSYFIQPNYADEALTALEAAGWTITPPTP